MDIQLPATPMIIAVSGGVDSVVLLDVIAKKCSDHTLLTVAHFDHGMRHNSHHEATFVAGLCSHYGIRFAGERAELGHGASEDIARISRYEFLRRVKQQFKAASIVTAHHADDRVETAIINIMRGTGRMGLSSLQSRGDVIRPFLSVSKQEIIAYAKQHDLRWREDPTNDDPKYLRNYVRKNIVPKCIEKDPDFSHKMTDYIIRAQSLNDQIAEVMHLIPGGLGEYQRYQFNMLPHAVSAEVIKKIITEAGATEIHRGKIERLVVAAKTGLPGKSYDICNHLVLRLGRRSFAIENR